MTCHKRHHATYLSAVASAIRCSLDQLHLTAPQLELVPTVVPAALRALAAQEATPA